MRHDKSHKAQQTGHADCAGRQERRKSDEQQPRFFHRQTQAARYIVTQLQQEVTKVMDAQYSSFSQKASATIEKTSAQAPVGGDVFAAAMKSMLDATNQAFSNMQNMAKQMGEIADANLQAASTATAKAVGAAATPAKKK